MEEKEGVLSQAGAHEKEGEKRKNIKVCLRCYTLLKAEKHPSETYDGLFLRLLRDTKRGSEGLIEGSAGSKLEDKTDIKNEITSFLSSFGVTPSDIGALTKQYLKNDNLKLKLPKGKPLDVNKAIKTVSIAVLIGFVVVIAFPYIPQILEALI